MADRLHSSLRTDLLDTQHPQGFVLRLLRLQHGRDSVVHSVHAVPNTLTSFGIQGPDVLVLTGFRRSVCTFERGECFVKEVPANFELPRFGEALVAARAKLEQARADFERCGITLEQPEGWGFFYGKPAMPVRAEIHVTQTNGHVASKVEHLSELADEVFRYVLTSLHDSASLGWTLHYRAVNPPLSGEIERALGFLRGFQRFAECPEFDFQECRWRFVRFLRGSTPFDSNAGDVHRAFQAHPTNFSAGLHALLDANAVLEPFWTPLLTPTVTVIPDVESTSSSRTPSGTLLPERFEVAISFAGSQREPAEVLAKTLRDHGVTVFYDNFYPEHLWGKDLVVFFDEVYRRRSRYCVMFVSKEYAQRMWTNHERRSAQARALEERGNEYILPIRVDEADLPGLPRTIGFLSLNQTPIGEVAEMLLKKLGRA